MATKRDWSKYKHGPGSGGEAYKKKLKEGGFRHGPGTDPMTILHGLLQTIGMSPDPILGGGADLLDALAFYLTGDKKSAAFSAATAFNPLANVAKLAKTFKPVKQTIKSTDSIVNKIIKKNEKNINRLTKEIKHSDKIELLKDKYMPGYPLTMKQIDDKVGDTVIGWKSFSDIDKFKWLRENPDSAKRGIESIFGRFKSGVKNPYLGFKGRPFEAKPDFDDVLRTLKIKPYKQSTQYLDRKLKKAEDKFLKDFFKMEKTIEGDWIKSTDETFLQAELRKLGLLGQGDKLK